ncbi:unnamed protein product [Notodromas monacha]|uniref:Vesicle transport protein GOT1B n=1 Tax=Notodromas monacha TaxID=399045 RepID=A0A7R9BI17_9CRUS|nr:unnamed protein product [Notodromas monacha]CAG0915891.1 unnamed protein product [Notodromas monacha]
MFEISEVQKIGVGLVCFGIGFFTLGIILMLDRALMAMGNILFIAGVGFVMGHQRLLAFFTDRQKIKGTLCFSGGVAFVLIGWPFVGMVVELYGSVLLFKHLIPMVLLWLRQVPVIGMILRLPGISSVVDTLSDDSKSIV